MFIEAMLHMVLCTLALIPTGYLHHILSPRYISIQLLLAHVLCMYVLSVYCRPYSVGVVFVQLLSMGELLSVYGCVG